MHTRLQHAAMHIRESSGGGGTCATAGVCAGEHSTMSRRMGGSREGGSMRKGGGHDAREEKTRGERRS